MEKRIPNTTGDETIGTLDRLWDKFVDADIIDNPDEDIYHEDGTDIYEITTNEGYVVEIIVKEDGTVEIEEIVKGDNLPPRIGEITTSGTTNSIHVEVSITRSTGETKLSYYYKKDGEPDTSYVALKEGVTDLTANFTGLEQGEIYNIRVVVEDQNGSTEKIINERTGELTEGTIKKVGEIEWSNGTATLKLETTETREGIYIVYQIGDIDGEWQPYSEETGINGLEHEDIVYAAISDGTNESKESTFEIEDGEEPEVTITKDTVTTRSIKVKVIAEDKEWGMPESPTYNYYIKKNTDSSYPSTGSYTVTDASYTFDNLEQNTSYDIKVEVKDKAGNIGSKEIKGISTGTIGGATSNLVSGNIIASSPTWSNGKASITLSKGTGVASNLSIQWQINKIDENGWTIGESVIGLKHNDIVYARLTDGVNNGKEASVTIKDGTAPNAPTISITSGTKGNNNYYKSNVTVTITAGSDGQSGASKVRYKVTGAQTVAQKDTAAGTTSTSVTISTNGKSTITAYTIDKAGNVSGAKTQVVYKDNTAPSTASLSIGTVGETSIAVTAKGLDATSGVYSYAFQRSTTSATSGFTTVKTQTSTATSLSYTYTGLTAGTTYYLRVIVTDKAGNTKTGTAIKQKTNDKIYKTNTQIKDDYGNIIWIPGGFKIASDSGKKVSEGIVIEDLQGNQFVWIPVGTYKVSQSATKTNNLSRRTFTSNGATEIKTSNGDGALGTYAADGVLHYYYGEGDSRSVAYSTIETFKSKATSYGGFYIGRYEQGTGNVIKKNVEQYVNITMEEAKKQAEDIEKGNNYVKSELISSYAWDTALNFICQNNGYHLATTKDSKYANINTKKTTKTGMYEADNYSNICDMIGTIREWTTEFCTGAAGTCVYRSGQYPNDNDYAAYRFGQTQTYTRGSVGFRTQMYLK